MSNDFRVTPAIVAATREYFDLYNRVSHPAGDFDKAGRFTLKNYFRCCNGISDPTRRFPYPEMLHGRTIAHAVSTYNSTVTPRYRVTPEEVRAADRITTDFGFKTLLALSTHRTLTVAKLRSRVLKEGASSRSKIVSTASAYKENKNTRSETTDSGEFR